ncbi:hypothetical protein [Miniphocaeibacter massiliensis]|uniref:hypothetical protein n=1 Tax=Miniphocaeibacter massiliensis TaxID=2041841 RepID=UPI000C1BC438|nr:hypothetical protein [Miniphocaeibacter massiliensis]
MVTSIFVRREEEKVQIEALKKSIRIYFEGDVDYNQRLDFIEYDISKDEDLLKILEVFDNRYSIDELKNLKKDIMITAFNKDSKIIFVYDGRGKFTDSRKKTLENYPENIKLGYPLEYWIEKCGEIKETSTVELPTALKDSLTDIICAKNGYTVIRIMDEEFDWREEGAMERLTKIIDNSKKGTFDLQ